MDGPEFAELFREYVSPRRAASDESTLQTIYRLVHSVMHTVGRRVRRILSRHEDGPLLCYYGNDGWGAFVSSYTTAEVDGKFLNVI